MHKPDVNVWKHDRAIGLRLAVMLLMLAAAVAVGCSTSSAPTPSEVESSVDTGNEDEVEYVPSAEEVSPETKTLPTPPLRPNTPAAGKGTAVDSGDFVPIYESLQNPGVYGGLERTFKNVGILESVSNELNKEWSLPTNITLTLRECGTINALYEPSIRRVSMCYEYLDFFERLFVQSGGNSEDAAQGIEGATYYTLYHEIGHALINVLDLPVTGREEDVVDQLSTYILVEKGGEKGENMALSGAQFWYLLARRNKQVGRGQAYWDEHSTNEQRFYNTICWLYGSNPTKYSHLVNAVLPNDRAVRCPNEYARFVKGWRNALAPFSKN